MKELRAQGVSLEIIAGAYHMDMAEVEGLLGKEELGAQERVSRNRRLRNPGRNGSATCQQGFCQTAFNHKACT